MTGEEEAAAAVMAVREAGTFAGWGNVENADRRMKRGRNAHKKNRFIARCNPKCNMQEFISL